MHCRCGNVGLEITGQPVVQAYCHCEDCRAAHGAAYVASSTYPGAAVQVVQGTPTPIVVKTTPRMRCEDCGTHLFSEITEIGLRSVNAFLLPVDAFKPQFHVQCQHAILPVVDELPHFKDFPAAGGGSGELVGW
ncbi:GFA family protein [Salinisphaera hydrothermalis]|uniref:GFA family protein n=1 Tax=Salinisphaera hydrothermalis TaxID=563188 RepID=UPI003340ADFE